MLRVHVKMLQNNQQIKELQAAYKNRKRFTISLNGTYAKLLWSGTIIYSKKRQENIHTERVQTLLLGYSLKSIMEVDLMKLTRYRRI